MWYGKDTPELLKLKVEYEKKLGHNPDGEMDVEYGQDSYALYLDDIKTCIKEGISIGDLCAREYDDEDGDWW